MDTTSTKNNSNGLKAIIAILSLLLIGSLVYMYKLTEDATTSLSLVKSEKEAVMRDLALTKQTLEETIASNSTMSEELMAERDKVQQLMAELEKTKSTDASAIVRIKGDAQNLKAKINDLLRQIEGLKKENASLSTKVDSTSTELKKAKVVNDTLISRNDYLAKTVEKGSKLSVVNLQTSAVKQKSNGKQIATDKASRANILKISFTIAENQIAKSGDKTYYVQIIDSKNNVLGDKKMETFGEKVLTYSFASSIRYENKTVKIEKDLPVSEITEGTFFVNVFDKGELVSKNSFTLK
ncbi:hypothetical protein [Flavobacterium sp.]|uniref:hypothetical protein n=1 Tax=Flavobacterium sp. TaxID=239 RepID=UPI003D0CD612